jgi:hypothetical protein
LTFAIIKTLLFHSVFETPTLRISILFTNLAAEKGIESDMTRGDMAQSDFGEV